MDTLREELEDLAAAAAGGDGAPKDDEESTLSRNSSISYLSAASEQDELELVNLHMQGRWPMKLRRMPTAQDFAYFPAITRLHVCS